MGTRGAIRRLTGPALAALALTACSTGDTGDPGFIVVGTSPDQGAEDVTAATEPEFRVNAAADEATCTTESLDFVGLNEDGTVAFHLEYGIAIENEGSKIRFLREDPLTEGHRYATLVNTAADTPCTDLQGRPLEAFGLEFIVP